METKPQEDVKIDPALSEQPSDITALTTQSDNDWQNLLEEDEGAGTENVKFGDTAMPFIALLQSLNPQVDAQSPKYINGAQSGMFLDTVSKDLYDGKTGIDVVPVYFIKKYNVWKKRDLGGGFFGSFATEAEAKASLPARDRKNPTLITLKAEDADIVETAEHYFLLRTKDGRWRPVLFPMKSSLLNGSRSLLGMIQAVALPSSKPGKPPFTPASYACVYNISSARQQNTKGVWNSIVVERVGMTPKDVYLAAKEFYEQLSAGKVDVDYEKGFDADVEANPAQQQGVSDPNRPKF